MIGQSKNIFQAEIDAACEFADFLRFNVSYLTEIYNEQPIDGPGKTNILEYRPLEGFIYSVTHHLILQQLEEIYVPVLLLWVM